MRCSVVQPTAVARAPKRPDYTRGSAGPDRTRFARSDLIRDHASTIKKGAIVAEGLFDAIPGGKAQSPEVARDTCVFLTKPETHRG